MIEVNLMQDITEATLHFLSYIHLLFVDRLNLNDFIFVFETEEEGIIYKVQVGYFF